MKKNIKSVKELSITSSNFDRNIQCRFEITERAARWDCSWGNYDMSASLFNSVDSILSSIEVKNKWVFSIPVLSFFTLLFFVYLFINFFLKSIPGYINDALLFVMFSYQIFYTFFKKTKNRISILHKEEEKNFWDRKKDDIIVNLGVAILAFLLGYFFKNK